MIVFRAWDQQFSEAHGRVLSNNESLSPDTACIRTHPTAPHALGALEARGCAD